MVIHDKVFEVDMHEVTERLANDIFWKVAGHFVYHGVDEPYDPFYCKKNSIVGVFKDLPVFFFAFTKE